MTVAKINKKWKGMLGIHPKCHSIMPCHCYCILILTVIAIAYGRAHHCYCILICNNNDCEYYSQSLLLHIRRCCIVPGIELTSVWSPLLTHCLQKTTSKHILCMTFIFIWFQSTKQKYLSCGWTLSLLLLAMSSSLPPYMQWDCLTPSVHTLETLWYGSIYCPFPGVKQIIKI